MARTYPKAFYETQEAAVGAARRLACEKGVTKWVYSVDDGYEISSTPIGISHIKTGQPALRVAPSIDEFLIRHPHLTSDRRHRCPNVVWLDMLSIVQPSGSIVALYEDGIFPIGPEQIAGLLLFGITLIVKQRGARHVDTIIRSVTPIFRRHYVGQEQLSDDLAIVTMGHTPTSVISRINSPTYVYSALCIRPTILSSTLMR